MPAKNAVSLDRERKNNVKDMGQTLVIYKIYPDEPGAEVEVEKSLWKIKIGEVKDVKKEPLAFGMYILRVAILLPEKEEPMNELEAEIRAIPKVQNVEVETMTLL